MINIFKPSIRTRVKNAMNARIDRAEQAHKKECEDIDKEAEIKKNEAADNHVQRILGN